jgi:hypothetical protein
MMIDPARILQAVAQAVPAVIPYLNDETKAAIKAADGYPGVRSDYYHAVYDEVYGYLTGNRPVTTFVQRLVTAAASAFINAAEIGYQDGGATLPLDDETAAWLRAATDSEFQHIDTLFERLSQEWEGIDPATEATARAEGYIQHLDTILSEAKVRAAGNKMLTFDGDDGKESCPECKKLKGKRHRASWWISNGLIPGPGNENFTCNGYNCEHRLFDDEGNEYSI